MGRKSPGPTRWPSGAEGRLVPKTSNLKPQTVPSVLRRGPQPVHRGCFVWALTPPLSGWMTPRRAPQRYVRVLPLLGRVGRAGLLVAFCCASPSLRPFLSLCLLARAPPGLRCPVFLGLFSPLLPLFFFSFFVVNFFCAPAVSGFPWFPALGALGLGTPCPPPPFVLCRFFPTVRCLWLSMASGPG